MADMKFNQQVEHHLVIQYEVDSDGLELTGKLSVWLNGSLSFLYSVVEIDVERFQVCRSIAGRFELLVASRCASIDECLRVIRDDIKDPMHINSGIMTDYSDGVSA